MVQSEGDPVSSGSPFCFHLPIGRAMDKRTVVVHVAILLALALPRPNAAIAQFKALAIAYPGRSGADDFQYQHYSVWLRGPGDDA